MNAGAAVRSLTDLLFHPTPEGWCINISLWLLFLYGWWRLSRTVEWIRRNHARVRQLAEDPDAARFSPPGAPPAVRELEPDRHVRLLLELRGLGKPAQAALAEIRAEADAVKLEMPRYLSGVLVLVGLAGTVWGLQGILGQVTGSLSGSQDTGDSIIRALAPIRTAFSCTFWGILLSVLIAWRTARAEEFLGTYHAELDEFLLRRVAPVLFPRSEADQAQRLADAAAQIPAALQGFESALQTSQYVFSEVLKQGMQEAVAGLVSSLDQVRSAGEQLAASAGSISRYREELLAEHQRFSAVLHEVREASVKMTKQAGSPLAESARAMSEATESLVQLGAVWKQDAASLVAEVRRVTSDLQEPLQRQAAQLEATSMGARDLYAAATQGFQDVIRQNLETLCTVHARLDDLIQQVRPETLKLPNGRRLGAALDDLAAVMQQASAQQERTAQGLGQVAQQITTSLSDVRDTVRAAGRRDDRLEALLSRQLSELHRISRHTESPLTRIWDRWSAKPVPEEPSQGTEG